MAFINKKRIAHSEISIDNQTIDEVSKTKLLDVIINSRLNWNYYISYICGKISCGRGMLIKVRSF